MQEALARKGKFQIKLKPAAPSFSASCSNNLKFSALFKPLPPVTTTRAFARSGRSVSWDVRPTHVDFPILGIQQREGAISYVPKFYISKLLV